MDRDAGRVLDELLVVSAMAGSTAAFGQIVGRWTPRLWRHAERLLLDADRASDAVQDTRLNIARTLSRLDDPAKFPGWAYAIVTRRCVDPARAEAPRTAGRAPRRDFGPVNGQSIGSFADSLGRADDRALRLG